MGPATQLVVRKAKAAGWPAAFEIGAGEETRTLNVHLGNGETPFYYSLSNSYFRMQSNGGTKWDKGIVFPITPHLPPGLMLAIALNFRPRVPITGLQLNGYTRLAFWSYCFCLSQAVTHILTKSHA